MAAVKHDIETTYINLWVESGVYELVVNNNVAESMRRLKIDLVDVNHVLRTGFVVRSDMVEQRGLWDVQGETVDNATLEITVAVISSEYEVELVRILKLKRSQT